MFAVDVFGMFTDFKLLWGWYVERFALRQGFAVGMGVFWAFGMRGFQSEGGDGQRRGPKGEDGDTCLGSAPMLS